MLFLRGVSFEGNIMLSTIVDGNYSTSDIVDRQVPELIRRYCMYLDLVSAVSSPPDIIVFTFH